MARCNIGSPAVDLSMEGAEHLRLSAGNIDKKSLSLLDFFNVPLSCTT